MKGDPQTDPKGLILEAFRIDGITPAECRSIFLDWALSLPDGQEPGPAIRALLQSHADKPGDHPMVDVLRQGLTGMSMPRRRGGWRSRPRN
ncbi:hypothetical protein [Pukyongiella litopenaei]|uniref:Uncharacterized protein n=1 Tax=Pukyongiella litopenaei TaxID=2605946 RepID=A0A2S0MTQ7_9RHOB|nr:hypothetical protein [Pukyongiella litopenaei]AVO39111.1 hypothetical protein C6Y53_16255 [Pukyongiella litopenaei]